MWIPVLPVAAILAVAACSSGAARPRAATTSVGAGETHSPIPSMSPSPTRAPAGQSTASPASAPGGTAPGPARPSTVVPTTSAGCSAGRLALTQTGGQGAAGTIIRTYGLRNTGATGCVLYGFPGVSLVDAQGRQLGQAATRQGPAGGEVRLASGASASFQVSLSYGGCDPGAPHSSALRIYPPGDRGSLLTPYELPACRTPTVTAVRAAG